MNPGPLFGMFNAQPFEPLPSSNLNMGLKKCSNISQSGSRVFLAASAEDQDEDQTNLVPSVRKREKNPPAKNSLKDGKLAALNPDPQESIRK